MSAYTKERLLVVAFLLLFIATGHPWIWTFLMGVRNNQRVFGFPLHYFVSLVLFFVGITVTSLAWVYVEGRVAEEITSDEDDTDGAEQADRADEKASKDRQGDERKDGPKKGPKDEESAAEKSESETAVEEAGA